MARLYGESISKDVVKQLNARTSILGRDGIRSTNDLRYLNEKTSWIRMISGANLLTPSGYSNLPAKKFILSGGELTWDGSKFVRRTGISTNTGQGRGRYSYDTNLGIRPEAGITSFSISHKNRYGTIREANITFNVWTRDDLNLAQDLFLRPGISIIVEWGNSIYLDDDGNVKDTIEVPRFEEYFKTGKRDRIAEILRQNKITNNFNYDGFIGLITNFSWSFRPDGGYDCSVKAVTTGLVLESISMLKSTAEVESELRAGFKLDYFKGERGVYYDISLKDQVKAEQVTKEAEKEADKSFLHFFIKQASDISMNPADKGEANRNKPLTYSSFEVNVYQNEVLDENTREKRPSPFIQALKEELGFISNTEIDPYFFVPGFDANIDDNKEKVRYVSLRTFLALLNISFISRKENGERITSFYTGNIEVDHAFENDPKFKTFSNHFSLNPLFCLLPNIPSQPELLDLDNKPIIKVEKGKVTENILKYSKGPKDSIFNIFVNLSAIKEDLDNLYENITSPQSGNVFDFIRTILGKISNSLGGINEFDLHFDEDIQKWVVIDRAKIVDDVKKNKEDIVNLDLTGLKSVASEVSLQTKITNELSSQIAISGQIQKPQDINSSLPLIDWNSNIQDRFAYEESNDSSTTFATGVSRLTEEEEKKNEEVDSRAKFLNTVKQAYTDLNAEKKFFAPYKFKTEVFEKIKSEGIKRTKRIVYKKSFEDSADPVEGLIPIDLTIRMDGISGFKIGQIFTAGNLNKPSNILPDIYNGYGFIITKLDNEIQNNKWFTNLGAITFKLNNVISVREEDTTTSADERTPLKLEEGYKYTLNFQPPDNSNTFETRKPGPGEY